MILQQYDDTTGEFKIFSSKTGELVYEAIMKDHKLQQEIISAIRKTELITYNYTKNMVIQYVEIM